MRSGLVSEYTSPKKVGFPKEPDRDSCSAPRHSDNGYRRPWPKFNNPHRRSSSPSHQKIRQPRTRVCFCYAADFTNQRNWVDVAWQPLVQIIGRLVISRSNQCCSCPSTHEATMVALYARQCAIAHTICFTVARTVEISPQLYPHMLRGVLGL